MRRIEYRFKITSKLLGEVLRIAEQGQVSYAFMYDLRALYDQSKLTPNKDMSWYIGKLISRYYSAELIAYDATFNQINDFLLSEWRKTMPEEMELRRKTFTTKYATSL